jgi:hypothetical protein
VKWSVAVVAEGDRVITTEEVVELADAVAASGGIASGIGTPSYGAQLIVEAEDGDEALELGVAAFQRAASVAGLPPWPVARAEAVSEDDELDYDIDERGGIDERGDVDEHGDIDEGGSDR